MRLTLAIFAASLTWSVLSAGLVAEIVGHADNGLLQLVAAALR